MDADKAEEKLHRQAIQALARETGISAEAVSSLYESVFARLKRRAKIRDFLPLLVGREVKDILLRRVNLSLMEYRNDHL
jgi:hypothetical protein